MSELEIFATVFTASSWGCWHEYIDPKINAVGWGYEWMLYEFCKHYFNASVFNIGILNRLIAIHNTHLGKVKGVGDWKSKGTINFSPGQQRDDFINHTKYLIS